MPKNTVRVSKKIRDLSPKQLQTLWFDRHNEITKLEVGSNKRLEEIPKSLMRMTAEHAVDYVLPNWLFTVTLNTNASSGKIIQLLSFLRFGANRRTRFPLFV